MTSRKTSAVNRRTLLAGVGASAVAAAVPLRHGLAASKIKVGILLPRSGPQAQVGIDCQRGADVAPEVLGAMGYPEMEYILGDTETKVDVARAQAEKLIDAGAHIIVGAFDSGQTMAAAQVCEQKNIPLVVNIAAVTKLTELGYKWVFRNFPTGPMIVGDAFKNQKTLFAESGATPKSVALLHVNDTFGTSLSGALMALAPKFKMPYKIVEKIPYDPYGRDFSAEVRKVKAAKPEALWAVSRLNDAIAITKELVRQRVELMGILSTGPGWYEDPYLQATGKYGDDVISLVPWVDYKKEMARKMRDAYRKKFPDRSITANQGYTFDAVLIVADAFKRAGSTKNTDLQAALRTTNITNNTTIGKGIRFNEKGQVPYVPCGAVQNRDGKQLVVLPKFAAVAEPIWPMRPWRER
ncbi:MAG: ABC transporter substrate-binding protein [Defluviicoccus sp.]|nr:ABC transporter substrate-binding protein [Defluviicoccus sp.]MDE0385604.1 ABC transporter substrate-binding protein [Defluviicoccus sp.]